LEILRLEEAVFGEAFEKRGIAFLEAEASPIWLRVN